MSHRTNRRRFLQTTAMTGVGFWVAGGVRAQPGKSPNERIAFASIGVGGKGSSDSGDAAKAGDLVAICDVDENTLNSAGQQRFPKAKRYTDFRKMLDEMGKSIDAVTVSTPDHCHAPAALMAMRMGKHCFCQKPLTRIDLRGAADGPSGQGDERRHADGQPRDRDEPASARRPRRCGRERLGPSRRSTSGRTGRSGRKAARGPTPSPAPRT